MNKPVACKTLVLTMDVPVNVDFEDIVISFNMEVLEKALQDRLLVDWVWAQEEHCSSGRPITPIRIGNNNPWEVSA